MGLGTFVLAVLLPFFVIFWGYQFVQLMCLSDADLPGRYDKVLWVAVFLLVSLLAPFLFLFWKGAYRSVREEEEDRSPRGRSGGFNQV